VCLEIHCSPSSYYDEMRFVRERTVVIGCQELAVVCTQENIMSRLSSKPSPSLPADVNDSLSNDSELTVCSSHLRPFHIVYLLHDTM